MAYIFLNSKDYILPRAESPVGLGEIRK